MIITTEHNSIQDIRRFVVLSKMRYESHIKSNRAKRNKLRQAKCIRWTFGCPAPIETEIKLVEVGRDLCEDISAKLNWKELD